MSKRRTRFRWATAPARNSPDSFSRRLYVLTLRVAGALVREDESLLTDRERWADEVTDEMHRIGGDHIVTDYDHETGGRPSSRAVQDTPYVTTTDLERKVSDAIERVTMFHVPNAEHSETMAERGARGGKVSRRGNTFTLADFAPYAHLTNAAAARKMGCSPRTVASRRKLYNETVSESVQSKPSNPPGLLETESSSSSVETGQQEATHPPVDTPPSSAVTTPLPEDTPPSELVQYYDHEDVPQLPSGFDDLFDADNMVELFPEEETEEQQLVAPNDGNRFRPRHDGDRWMRERWERVEAGKNPEFRMSDALRAPSDAIRAELSHEQELREVCQAIFLDAET